MNPEIRSAHVGDLDQLQRLETEARDALIGTRGGDRWLADHPALADGWADRIESGSVLVGEIDGVVVGFLIGEVVETRAEVHAVYVTPLAREVGFGDALLDTAITRYRQAGALTLDAEALPGDRHTKNLYERAGIKARLITVSIELDPPSA